MDLTAEIDLLDRRLLSEITTLFPDPLSDEEKISVNAFLVLGHACIEEHVETSFLAHAKRLEASLASPLAPLDAARATLAFGLLASDRLRASHSYAKRDLAAFVAHAIREYESALVQQNHGVKAHNIKKLAEGLGIPWQEFDARLSS